MCYHISTPHFYQAEIVQLSDMANFMSQHYKTCDLDLLTSKLLHKLQVQPSCQFWSV